MARIRTVKPKFWDDIKLAKVSRDARLSFIGLWTFADDAGVVVADPGWLKSKIFPSDDFPISDVLKWINELIAEKFLAEFEFRGEKFLFIPNFLKHQKIEKPNHCDLNIPYKLLIKTLKHSPIDRRLIADASTIIPRLYSKGKDSRVKDSKENKTKENYLWGTEKEKFLKDGNWIFKFTKDKRISVNQFDAAAAEFINDLELKEDFKDIKELRKHFTNWFNKNKATILQSPGESGAMPKHLKKIG
jgi:hypothetical protein